LFARLISASCSSFLLLLHLFVFAGSLIKGNAFQIRGWECRAWRSRYCLGSCRNGLSGGGIKSVANGRGGISLPPRIDSRRREPIRNRTRGWISRRRGEAWWVCWGRASLQVGEAVGAAAGEAVVATGPLSCRREGASTAVGVLPLVALPSLA
jgi:hypothetical protein